MNFLNCSLVSTFVLFAALAVRGDQPPAGPKIVLVIHGGAGTLSAERTPEQLADYEATLSKALRAGYDALNKDGGTSLDAVEEAIKVMEDSPLFNAGTGAVFTHEGRIELDASIMEGREKRAGAVASVTRIKNPIVVARAVMEKSPHVLLVGEGAERFALGVGIPEINPAELWTERRWKELREALEREKHPDRSTQVRDPEIRELGTVGAVALDRHGDLAAGTSTGGMTNKRAGRVGDSPIVGAGTYAENGACGVSCTGHGELFIRYAVAHEIVATMRLGGERSVGEAVRKVLARLPKEPRGVGGIIALDGDGNAAMEFDSEGMYRGTITEQGVVKVAIGKAE